MNARTPIQDRAGSVLVVVLWVVGILAILMTSFVFDAHIEARLTSYYRKRTKAGYLALSGIEVARQLMSRRNELKGESDDTESEFSGEWWYDSGKRLSEGLAIRGMTHELGEGTVTLDIVPEPARRNVNRLTEEDWERIFEISGVPEEIWPDLIESFSDWTDKDEEPRLDGAETEDYYATLERPYQAKNGPLDTVGELLLVRGFSRAILYGGVLDWTLETEEPVQVKGIAELLTVYGDGKVNVNAASTNVLMTLPEVDDIAAGAIIEEREGLLLEDTERGDTSFKNVGDFFGRIPGMDQALNKYLTTESAIYRITSVGTVGGVRRTIWCIAQYDRAALRFLRWREEN